MAIPGPERLPLGLVKSRGLGDKPTLRQGLGLLKAADAKAQDPLKAKVRMDRRGSAPDPGESQAADAWAFLAVAGSLAVLDQTRFSLCR